MSEQRNDSGEDAATGTEGRGAGEVSSPPSRERRAEDPGSMATEFGDRADEAPDSEIAHPTI